MYGVELAISNNINQGLGREGVRIISGEKSRSVIELLYV